LTVVVASNKFAGKYVSLEVKFPPINNAVYLKEN